MDHIQLSISIVVRNTLRDKSETLFSYCCDIIIFTTNLYTVFNLIGARGAYINLFSTTSVKRSSSGR